MTDFRADPLDPFDPLVPASVGWGWLLAYGIASVVLGLLAFLWPVAATLTATIAIGLALVISGAFAAAAGRLGRGVESRGYTIALGIVSLLVGLIMLFAPAAGAVSLTLLVAVWLLVRGVLELALGARYRRHRGAMIALGVVNVLLAIYVFATLPWSALTLPGFILGVSFFAGGAVAIGQALAHRPARRA